MERKKYLLIIFLFTFCFCSLKASYQQEIFECYIHNDMPRWEKIVIRMDAQKEKSNEFIVELLNYEYGYTAWCIWQNKITKAQSYMAKAEENVAYLEKKGYRLSLMYSYKAAFTGLKIGLNKFKAPYLGIKCIEYAKESIKLDVRNPYGQIQTGNIFLYSPAIFGGSKEKALACFQKAAQLMENQNAFIPTDWNYLNLLTTIARTHIDLYQYKEAEMICKKILHIAPDFLWVKNELYPSVLKKL